MNSPKKNGFILVLSAMVAIGIYRVGNSRIGKRKTPDASPENPSAVKLTSFDSATDSFAKPLIVSSPIGAANQPVKNNLTQSFSETLFEQVQAAALLRQEDETAPDLKSISEELVGKLVNRNLPEIGWVTKIDESRLKISADNSKNGKEDYLKTLSLINRKNFDGFEKNYLEVVIDVYQKINPDSATRLADIYQNLAQDYQKTAAPPDWLSLHKKLIIYAENAELVYRTMAQYPADPLKGYLALEALESLTASGEEMRNIFQKEAGKIGL